MLDGNKSQWTLIPGHFDVQQRHLCQLNELLYDRVGNQHALLYTNIHNLHYCAFLTFPFRPVDVVRAIWIIGDLIRSIDSCQIVTTHNQRGLTSIMWSVIKLQLNHRECNQQDAMKTEELTTTLKHCCIIRIIMHASLGLTDDRSIIYLKISNQQGLCPK